MREIKFRAKHVDTNEWIYGYYVSQYGSHEIYTDNTLYDFERYHIDPKTLGQFTGLKDKNGKEIYDKDILKEEYGDKSAIKITIVEHGCSSNTDMDSDYIYGFHIGSYSDSNFEVIGNIHDNPELLKY